MAKAIVVLLFLHVEAYENLTHQDDASIRMHRITKKRSSTLNSGTAPKNN